MCMQRHIKGNRQIGAGAQQFRRGRIPGVRRDGRLDQVMIQPFFDEAAAADESIFIGGGIRRRENQDRLAQQRAHADAAVSSAMASSK